MCVTRWVQYFSSFFEVEPKRDVSFIKDEGERSVLQDMIDATNTIPWAWHNLRKKEISETLVNKIRSAMKHEHSDEEFKLLFQLLTHMAIRWTVWAENRKNTQNMDVIYEKEVCEWKEKHKWNANMNNVILLAYLENIYTFCDKRDITGIQRLQYGIDKIIFDLEVSLARVNLEDMQSYKNYVAETGDPNAKKVFQESLEYKLEICKRLSEIPLPSTYKFCKTRWSQHRNYIETCETMKKNLEKEYSAQYESIQHALVTLDYFDLKNALDMPLTDMTRIRRTSIYKKASMIFEQMCSEGGLYAEAEEQELLEQSLQGSSNE
jgi:hypothetical protein